MMRWKSIVGILVSTALGFGACSSSSKPEADPEVVSACERMCDAFVGGSCYAACETYCASECLVTMSPSDFEGVVSVRCETDNSFGFFNGGSSLGCSFEGTTSGSNGTGTQKRVFVTKTTYSANLAKAGGAATGLEGADNLCNLAAQAASLGGVWKAWLSDDTTDAIDRMGDVGPWLNVSRTAIIVQNKATLTQTPNQSTWYDLTDEHGDKPPTGNVWTGTIDGGRRSDRTCASWTSESFDVYGHVGAVGTNVSSWTDSIFDSCFPTSNPLYCFEQ